jgi:hypothetical protein
MPAQTRSASTRRGDERRCVGHPVPFEDAAIAEIGDEGEASNSEKLVLCQLVFTTAEGRQKLPELSDATLLALSLRKDCGPTGDASELNFPAANQI